MFGCVLRGCQANANLVFLNGCYAVAVVFCLVAYFLAQIIRTHPKQLWESSAFRNFESIEPIALQNYSLF